MTFCLLTFAAYFRQASQFHHRKVMHQWQSKYPIINQWATISEDRLEELGEDYLSNFGMVVSIPVYSDLTFKDLSWKIRIYYDWDVAAHI